MNLKRTHKYRNLEVNRLCFSFFITIGTWEHIRIGEGSLQGKTESAYFFLHLGALEHHTHTHTHNLVFFLGPTETTFGMHCSFHFALTFWGNVDHLLCCWFAPDIINTIHTCGNLWPYKNWTKSVYYKVICKVTLSSPAIRPSFIGVHKVRTCY
jgi:hypothetical protein